MAEGNNVKSKALRENMKNWKWTRWNPFLVHLYSPIKEGCKTNYFDGSVSDGKSKFT